MSKSNSRPIPAPKKAVRTFHSILGNMTEVNLRRLTSQLISTPSLSPAQTELAQWVMDTVTGKSRD